MGITISQVGFEKGKQISAQLMNCSFDRFDTSQGSLKRKKNADHQRKIAHEQASSQRLTSVCYLSLWITQVSVINYIIFFTVLKLSIVNFSKLRISVCLLVNFSKLQISITCQTLNIHKVYQTLLLSFFSQNLK